MLRKLYVGLAVSLLTLCVGQAVAAPIPSSWRGLNPQPEPPSVTRGIIIQNRSWEWRGLNPQPEPPSRLLLPTYPRR